jgi:ubiquinone biosynthesis protein UbiJ
LGGWAFDFRLELGVATDVTGTFMETVGEVAAASVVEVAVKEPKRISRGLVRMSTMLTEKTTPDRATCCTASSRSPLPGAPTIRR